jgi:chromosomal replication initiation ATPase DnaA
MNKKIKTIFWQTCIKYLQSTLPMKNFIEYICPIQAYTEEKTLILLCPNNYIKEKIENNYVSIIKNIMQNITDKQYEIKIIIGSITKYRKNISQDLKKEKNIFKEINNFIKSAFFMTIKNPGKLYNPIFIQEEKNIKKINIINFILEEFKDADKEITYTIMKNDCYNIDYKIKNKEILIIEDLHNIKLNQKNQQKLQKLLELMVENKNQVIILSNDSLKKLKNINEKTKNIILKGLTLKINKNKENTKTKKQISINKIINSVISYYNIDIEKIKNKKRQKSIVLIRQIIFYLCKTLTHKTFSEISSSIGDYTNSNIIYSYNKIRKLMEKDITLKSDINKIKNIINK